MTLTVRLDAATESALQRYCTERGVTKSLVVQESLAAYLLQSSTEDDQRKAAPGTPGPVFKAFDEAGLIGCVELGGRSATKAVVRERATQRIRRRSP